MMFGVYFIMWIKFMGTWRQTSSGKMFLGKYRIQILGVRGVVLFCWDPALLVSTGNSQCSDNQIGSASFPLREDFGVSLGMNSIGARTESNFLLHVALPHCVPSPLTQSEILEFCAINPILRSTAMPCGHEQKSQSTETFYLGSKLAELMNDTCVKTFHDSRTGENSPMNTKNGI